jgi:hypothetical protein
MGRYSVGSTSPAKFFLADEIMYSDIIDTEPSSGDVNKMLLGSFVEEYDEDDEESVSQGTPIQLMDSPPGLGQQATSPTRTSTFQTRSQPEAAPRMYLPTINWHTPPTRIQTRENTLNKPPTLV